MRAVYRLTTSHSFEAKIVGIDEPNLTRFTIGNECIVGRHVTIDETSGMQPRQQRGAFIQSVMPAL